MIETAPRIRNAISAAVERYRGDEEIIREQFVDSTSCSGLHTFVGVLVVGKVSVDVEAAFVSFVSGVADCIGHGCDHYFSVFQ